MNVKIPIREPRRCGVIEEVRKLLPEHLSFYGYDCLEGYYSIMPYLSQSDFVFQAMNGCCSSIYLGNDEDLVAELEGLQADYGLEVAGLAGTGLAFVISPLSEELLLKLDEKLKSMFGLMDDGDFTVAMDIRNGFVMVTD